MPPPTGSGGAAPTVEQSPDLGRRVAPVASGRAHGRDPAAAGPVGDRPLGDAEQQGDLSSAQETPPQVAGFAGRAGERVHEGLAVGDLVHGGSVPERSGPVEGTSWPISTRTGATCANFRPLRQHPIRTWSGGIAEIVQQLTDGVGAELDLVGVLGVIDDEVHRAGREGVDLLG